jgi:dTDP-4-dehydrorhamnose 3,5-epimerase
VKFTKTIIPGAFIIDLEPLEDDRGFFARAWCIDEFQAQGLNTSLVQCSISFNRRRGTLRGMHYQARPHEEAKLIRCTMGAMYDVLLDLRSESVQLGKWFAVELTASNRRMVFCPEGVAHGFQTLVDDTELFYQMSHVYHPESARGVRWDDKAFNIEWPIANPIVAARDGAFPDFAAGQCTP